MKTVRFENGITLVMEKFFNIRSISAGIYVKNGSVNETAAENGISHFIEHMLFKGTDTRSARDIAAEIDRAGGALNAYTTKEYTGYYTRVLDTCFDNTFDILADMYFNSAFSEEDIMRERGVIDEEIDMYADTPDDLVHENLENSIWRGSSLGQPVLGTHETISGFDGKTLKTYMQSHYCADNTVISIAGNIDYGKTEALVRSYFGSFATKSAPRQKPQGDIYIPSFVSCKKDIEQQHMCIAFKGLTREDKDKYTMTVLNVLLGGSMSSLLFQHIREERGLAYSIYSVHSPYDDTGLFNVYAGFSRDKTELVKNSILDELFGFADNFDSEDMLNDAKQQLINGFLMSLENTSSVAGSIGRTMLLRGKVNSREEAIRVIEEVNTDMVKKLAKRVFIPDTQSISIVGR
ncbi:MAG: insulinase family protein [Firmicutes bacterium]|nr:insulinase family protein [Bacillota bacterium]